MFDKKYILNNYMLYEFAGDVEQRIADAKEKGEKLEDRIIIRVLPKDYFRVTAQYFHGQEKKEFQTPRFYVSVFVRRADTMERLETGLVRYNIANDWIGGVSFNISVSRQDMRVAVTGSTDDIIEDIDAEMQLVGLTGFQIYENDHLISTLEFSPEFFNTDKKFEVVTEPVVTDGERIKLIIPEEIKLVKTALANCKKMVWSAEPDGLDKAVNTIVKPTSDDNYSNSLKKDGETMVSPIV